MDRAAVAPERRADRAHTRAARALLLPELAARAADFALVLGLVGTAAQPAQVPPRSFMQQVLIDLRAKDRVRQLHLTDFLAIQIDYVDDRPNLVSLSSNLLRVLSFQLSVLSKSCLVWRFCASTSWKTNSPSQVLPTDY